MRGRRLRLLFALCAVAGATHAQPGGIEGQALRREMRGSDFDMMVMPTRESDSSARVDVYVQIPYRELAFVRDSDWFTARYELTLQIRTQGDSVVREKTFLESVRETSYDATAGRTGKLVFLQKSLSVPPGEYVASVTMTDNNARHPRVESAPLHVRAYRGSRLAMSGLLFADAIADVGGKRSITPHVSRDLSGLRTGAFVFFETYATVRDTMDLVYTCTPIPHADVFHSKRVPIAIDAGTSRHFFKAQTQQFSRGAYVMKVALVPHVADTNAAYDIDSTSVSASQQFKIEWGSGIPRTDEDLDHAISELRWVATQDEMDRIREAPNLEARRDAYKKFWDALDPTPGTARNEAMELYMARIRYANERFKGFGGEGYTSDQGMVYVIFGDPSNIESHPFDYVTVGMYHGPYVLWFYERYNRTYIFIDIDGFGNFRLASTPPVERFRYGQ